MRTTAPLTILAPALAAIVASALLPTAAWADEPQAAPASPSPPSPSPPPSPLPAGASSAVSRDTVAWGAAGVAAAAAIGATVFGVLALQNKSSYEQGATIANTDDGNNFAAYTDGCIFLAVAAGVTSLVLFLTDAPAASDPGAAVPKTSGLVSAVPVVTAHGGGVGAVLRF